MIFGAGRPGTAAVVTTASAAAMRESSTSCCLRLFLGRQLAGVAAGAVRADARIDELRAERLHLFLGRAAYVIRFDDGTQAAGRGDGLKSGDAGADDEHRRRPDRAGRGRQHRQELRQIVGGDQHGLVAGDGGLGRQGVHGLSPRYARDEFHGETGDAALLQGLHFGLAAIGLHVADDDRPRLQTRNLFDRQGLYSEQNLCLIQDGCRRIRPSDVLVGIVRESGECAETPLNEDLGARLGEFADNLGREADARFLRRAFAKRTYGDWHARPSEGYWIPLPATRLEILKRIKTLRC